jgi:hypothetical protein
MNNWCICWFFTQTLLRACGWRFFRPCYNTDYPDEGFSWIFSVRTWNVVTVRYISNIFPTSQFANYNHYPNCLNHSRCRYIKAERWLLNARGRIGYSTKVCRKLNVFIQEARKPKYSTPDVTRMREPHETAGSVTF